MNNDHRSGITVECHSRSVYEVHDKCQVLIVSRPVLIDGTDLYNEETQQHLLYALAGPVESGHLVLTYIRTVKYL